MHHCSVTAPLYCNAGLSRFRGGLYYLPSAVNWQSYKGLNLEYNFQRVACCQLHYSSIWHGLKDSNLFLRIQSPWHSHTCSTHIKFGGCLSNNLADGQFHLVFLVGKFGAVDRIRTCILGLRRPFLRPLRHNCIITLRWRTFTSQHGSLRNFQQLSLNLVHRTGVEPVTLKF